MNRWARIVLLIVLAVDALLLVYPPFQIRAGVRGVDLGLHWLPYLWHERRSGVSIDFVQLAAEIAIASVIGFTVFVLVRDLPAGEGLGGPIARLSLRQSLARKWATPGSALRWIVLGAVYMIGAAIVGLTLAFLVAIGWTIMAGSLG